MYNLYFFLAGLLLKLISIGINTIIIPAIRPRRATYQHTGLDCNEDVAVSFWENVLSRGFKFSSIDNL